MDLEELLELRPFSDEIPNNPIGRLKAFVRDLAFGAVSGYWDHGASFDRTASDTDTGGWFLSRDFSGFTDDKNSLFRSFVAQKWGGNIPTPFVLEAMGYFAKEVIGDRTSQKRRVFTEKAYELLDDVPQSPIFISYSRSDSSAFALLILARMKAVGLNPFLDITGLVGGDYWHTRLDEEIENSTHLLCLVGKTTLDSEYVRREIRLADEHGLTIIPVFHNGMQVSELDLDLEEARILQSRQIITVADESSEEYNRAIVRILNIFGVTP
jgi:hypothetical protein